MNFDDIELQLASWLTPHLVGFQRFPFKENHLRRSQHTRVDVKINHIHRLVSSSASRKLAQKTSHFSAASPKPPRRSCFRRKDLHNQIWQLQISESLTFRLLKIPYCLHLLRQSPATLAPMASMAVLIVHGASSDSSNNSKCRDRRARLKPPRLLHATKVP